jgi:anti-anti-sigma factor
LTFEDGEGSMPESGELETGAETPQSAGAADRRPPAMLPTEFGVQVRVDGSDAWVDLEGEIDMITSPRMREAVTEALAHNPRRLYLKMDLVSFVDSSALSVVAGSHKAAETQGCELIVWSPARGVRRVLALAGLSEHLKIDG